MLPAGPEANRRRKLRLINPRSPLSTLSMPQIIRQMTFSRRGLFMPLNLAICAAVAPEGFFSPSKILTANKSHLKSASEARSTLIFIRT